MITITGSLAYDHIMHFDGDFKDHIIEDNKENLSVSFVASNLEKHFGGTAGNIAYNFSLLNEDIFIISTIGKDYKEYYEHLEKHNISTENIIIVDDDITASAYILTDNKNSQIASFYGGAMLKSQSENILKKETDYVIIAPTAIDTMMKHCQSCIDNNIKFIFDPGQSMPMWTKEPLKKFIEKSLITIVNEYELSMIAKTLKINSDEIKELCKSLIVTLGDKGSVLFIDDKEIQIPIVKVDNAVDPTGCGDAYRAGILYGLTHDIDLEKSCEISSVIASFAVEHKGTQNHIFNFDDIKERYLNAYGKNL